VRQQFTAKERDRETGLDYFGARYYASTQGRFISIDPLLASGRPFNPQTWNRYAYALNNPIRFTDPSGLQEQDESGRGRPDPCKVNKCQTDDKGNRFYIDENGEEVYVINAERVIPNAERGFMTVEEALQQQAERRQSFQCPLRYWVWNRETVRSCWFLARKQFYLSHVCKWRYSRYAGSCDE
jgi:RHS repeat-associated protein